jgi:hypothetical protein
MAGNAFFVKDGFYLGAVVYFIGWPIDKGDHAGQQSKRNYKRN